MPRKIEDNIASPFESFEEKYNSVEVVTTANTRPYEHIGEEIDEAEKEIENEPNEEAFDDGTWHTTH